MIDLKIMPRNSADIFSNFYSLGFFDFKIPNTIYINSMYDWRYEDDIIKTLVLAISHETVHCVLHRIEGANTSRKMDNINFLRNIKDL